MTNWPSSACREASEALASSEPPIRVRWIQVGEDEDPTRCLDRPSGVDLIVGGSRSSHARLESRGLLRAIPRGRGDPAPEGTARGASPAAWKKDYGSLVWAASGDGAVGRDPGGADRLAATILGADPSDSRWGGLTTQGVAITSTCAQPETALRGMRTLVGAFPSRFGPHETLSPGASLLTELLEATLINAHDPLRAARVAIERGGDAAQALPFLTEPPPWPPASITKMRNAPGGDALIATLATQIAPDPEARSWLLQAFRQAPGPLDGSILDEIATAASGKLASEPRFREWLRAEWTAWARQRYRRVIRKVDDPRFAAP